MKNFINQSITPRRLAGTTGIFSCLQPMKSRVLAIALLLAVVHAALFGQGSVGNRGLRLRCDGVSSGYTLFAPMSSDLTYLVDLNGQVVRTWRSAFLPAA